MTGINHIICGFSFSFMQNKEEEYVYFKNDFYHLNFDKNLTSVEYNNKYVSLCLLFLFTYEIRLASHANKSLLFTWKKIPYLRWRKSTFNVYSLTESFINKPNTPPPQKKRKKIKILLP